MREEPSSLASAHAVTRALSIDIRVPVRASVEGAVGISREQHGIRAGRLKDVDDGVWDAGEHDAAAGEVLSPDMTHFACLLPSHRRTSRCRRRSSPRATRVRISNTRLHSPTNREVDRGYSALPHR